MKMIAHSGKLERALIAEGLVPANCRLLEIVVKPDSAPIIRFEVFVQTDDLVKLSKAFAVAAGDQ